MVDRTVSGGRNEAKGRFAIAEAYIAIAEVAIAETSEGQFMSVAAGNAVTAGIAASDAICYLRLGVASRSDDHRNACALLERATSDGKDLSNVLDRLLNVKNLAQYRAEPITRAKATSTIRWARKLIDRAREEIER